MLSMLKNWIVEDCENVSTIQTIQSAIKTSEHNSECEKVTPRINDGDEPDSLPFVEK